MTYLVFSWISSIAYTFLAIFSKLSSKKATQNPWLLNYVWTFASLLLLIPIAILNGVSMPQEWIFLVLAAATNAIWFILYAFSLYKLDVSVISPMYNFQTIFVIFLSFLFLNEQLFPYQIILIGLIFIAGIFASIDEEFHIKSFFNKSVLILIIGMMFLALSRVFTNITLKTNGLWESTLGIMFFTILILTPTIKFFKKDIKQLNKKQMVPLLLMSVSYVIGTIAAFEAFRSNVGISSVIISLPLPIIFVFFLSFFKPNLLEKHTIKVYVVRFIATAIMVVAALFLPAK